MELNSIVGRSVWIEFDPDHSGISFKSRKGLIVHVFQKPLEREAIVVELSKRVIIWFPFPHRVTHLVLQYHIEGNQTIFDTFRIGTSYAEVLELKNKNAMETSVLTKRDVSRLGAADIFNWPKPTADEIKTRRNEQRKS